MILRTEILPRGITHSILKEVRRRIHSNAEFFICTALQGTLESILGGYKNDCPEIRSLRNILYKEGIYVGGDGFQPRTLPSRLCDFSFKGPSADFQRHHRVLFLDALMKLPQAEE
jgi:hypothetical protein